MLKRSWTEECGAQEEKEQSIEAERSRSRIEHRS
jgi:hypothetical protein